MLIGYHASHEQFAPGELLAYVRLAERVEAACLHHVSREQRGGIEAYGRAVLPALRSTAAR